MDGLSRPLRSTGVIFLAGMAMWLVTDRWLCDDVTECWLYADLDMRFGSEDPFRVWYNSPRESADWHRR